MRCWKRIEIADTRSAQKWDKRHVVQPGSLMKKAHNDERRGQAAINQLLTITLQH